jgi:hypothetical protein
MRSTMHSPAVFAAVMAAFIAPSRRVRGTRLHSSRTKFLAVPGFQVGVTDSPALLLTAAELVGAHPGFLTQPKGEWNPWVAEGETDVAT